jgi:hypothetical protein
MPDPLSAFLFFNSLGVSSAAAAFLASNLVTRATPTTRASPTGW